MDSGEVANTETLCAESVFSSRENCEDKERAHCAVPSCRNASDGDDAVALHSFPKNMELADVWRRKCAISDKMDISSAKVCSSHFERADYLVTGEQVFPPHLRIHAVPHRNLPKNTSLDNTLSTVKPIVDENEDLKRKLQDLLDRSGKANEKSGLYDWRSRRLQRSSAVIRDKLKRLRDRETGIKKEKDLMSDVFSSAQIDVLLGRKKVKWSDDDLASAFTLRHMGGRECYLYLKNTLNIPLPALSCVQRWAVSDV